MASSLFRAMDRIAERNNWDFQRREGCRLECYTLRPVDYAEAEKMRRVLRRFPSLAVDCWSIPGDYKIFVFGAAEYDQFKRINAAKTILTNVFAVQLHQNGGDQAAAKEAQQLEAERLGTFGRLAFAEIYA